MFVITNDRFVKEFTDFSKELEYKRKHKPDELDAVNKELSKLKEDYNRLFGTKKEPEKKDSTELPTPPVLNYEEVFSNEIQKEDTLSHNEHVKKVFDETLVKLNTVKNEFSDLKTKLSTVKRTEHVSNLLLELEKRERIVEREIPKFKKYKIEGKKTTWYEDVVRFLSGDDDG
jgi:hypothetical protein